MRSRPPVGLARRFAYTAAMLAGVVLLAVTGTALWIISQQHEASVRRLLRKDAELQAAIVSSSLYGVASRMSEIADSSMLANALVDSTGKEAYLVPFLNGIQRIQGIPVGIVFTDFAGKEIASNSVGRFGPREQAWLAEQFARGKSAATVIASEGQEELLAVEFVLYSRSSSPEGALMYKIRLDDIPRQRFAILLRGDPAAHALATPGMTAVTVDTPPLFRALNFAVAGRSRDAGLDQPGAPLAAIFLLAAGLAGAVVAAGLHFGKKLTRELEDLEAFARGVAEKGFGAPRAQAARSLEVASLAQSLNRMLDRLNQQHDRVQHESEERYRMLVEGTSAIVFEATLPDFRYAFVSPQAEQMFGFALDDWLREGFWTWHVSVEDREHVQRLRAEAIARRTEYRVEYRLVDAAGTPLWIEEIGSILQAGEGGESSALRPVLRGILLDIRERKAAEERVLLEYRKVNRMKNEFISTASHELRTPLTSIRGSLGLLLGGVMGELPAPARTMLSMASQNCERLVRLINDMLDIEKIEAGKMVFHFARCELRPLLIESVDMHRSYGEQHHVHFVLDDDIPAVQVDVDRDRFLQVMANLLSNAAKFSHEHAEVRIAAEVSGEEVRIAVIDRGIGIPYEFHEKIFEKFSQVDSSDTRHKGGSGLGLNICRALVGRMGGTLGFSSTPGEGSVFYFHLPVRGTVTPADAEDLVA